MEPFAVGPPAHNQRLHVPIALRVFEQTRFAHAGERLSQLQVEGAFEMGETPARGYVVLTKRIVVL